MKDFSERISELREAIDSSDAIVIGLGAGMSASSGFDYSGERFEETFSDFHEAYGISDMYSGGFYPFPSPEEYWAWWSRMIWINRYECNAGKPYLDLLSIVRNKDYFIITTNVDHQVQKAGFDKKRLFYTQGDYGLFQCSVPCHQKTYDNESAVKAMVAEQENMRIPSFLVPHCPVCGKMMTTNLRCDDSFVEDSGWYEARDRYIDFIRKHENSHVLYLELGVGMNTPGIIKYPFWRLCSENTESRYVCVNQGEAYVPADIKDRSICIDGDIGKVLESISGEKSSEYS